MNMANTLSFDDVKALARSIPPEKWMRESLPGYEVLIYRALPDYGLALTLEMNAQEPLNTGVWIMRINEGTLAKYRSTTGVQELFLETRERCNAYKRKLESTTTRKELEGFGTPSDLIDKILGDKK